MGFKIDFVVTWVDDSDIEWQKKKNKYSGCEVKGMNSVKAYRNWGTFKYWFRGVEKYAPWVHKIYVVTDNQKPKWLDLKNSKVQLVNHSEIIDTDALPTFNSNAIEANVHKIKGLAENFVLFNDDMYIVSKTKPDDFFKDNLPCDIAAISPIIPLKDGTANFQVNNTEIINSYFSKSEIIKSTFSLKYGRNLIRTLLQLPSKFFCGYYEPHLPMSLKKSTFTELWEKESIALNKTTYSKFRSQNNTNVWLFREWQLAKGDFYPRNSDHFGKLFTLSENNENIWKAMHSHKYKVMCINDNLSLRNIDYVKKDFKKNFSELFPKKSEFEV